MTALSLNTDVDPALVGAVLVRHPVAPVEWWRELPQVPGSTIVTASFPAPPGARNSRRRPSSNGAGPTNILDARTGGYQQVFAPYPPGLLGPGEEPSADVLVTAVMRETHEQWWTELRGRAHRVFDLRMGPVLAVFESVLARHLDALGQRPDPRS
ncbi:MAG: hypothetical protein WD152_03000 [Nitriliruptoraceae bacterium]